MKYPQLDYIYDFTYVKEVSVGDLNIPTWHVGCTKSANLRLWWIVTHKNGPYFFIVWKAKFGFDMTSVLRGPSLPIMDFDQLKYIKMNRNSCLSNKIW